MRDFIMGAIVFIMFSAILGGCIYIGTSPEYWYAGQHDAMCEKTLHGERCGCYERLVQADKASNGNPTP